VLRIVAEGSPAGTDCPGSTTTHEATLLASNVEVWTLVSDAVFVMTMLDGVEAATTAWKVICTGCEVKGASNIQLTV